MFSTIYCSTFFFVPSLQRKKIDQLWRLELLCFLRYIIHAFFLSSHYIHYAIFVVFWPAKHFLTMLSSLNQREILRTVKRGCWKASIHWRYEMVISNWRSSNRLTKNSRRILRLRLIDFGWFGRFDNFPYCFKRRWFSLRCY